MPRFTPKRYEQIFSQMIAKIVARSKLSDISDTSVWKHILSSSARQDDEQYFQMTQLLTLFDLTKARGDDLDERAKEVQPNVIKRNKATKASGNIVFSRALPLGTVVIPAKTRVKTSDNKVFITTADTTITPTSPEVLPGYGIGRNSPLTPAVAELPGEDGNVDPNTIVSFVSKPPGVDEVTNPTKFNYGNNKESDSAFLDRILRFIGSLSRGTVTALESALLGVVDPSTGATIRYVKAVEDPINRGHVTVYIDDGTGSAATSATVVGEVMTANLPGPPPGSAVGGETYLRLDNVPIVPNAPITITSSIRGVLQSTTDYYLNTASGQVNFIVPLVTGEVITADYTHYTGLLQFAQKIIDGDPNDRANFPGYRAAGVLVTVSVPQILVQSVLAVLTILDGYDITDTIARVKNVIINYINTLGISGDIIRSELIAQIHSIPGVYDVNLITPATNVPTLDDQLQRTTSSNVVVS